MAAVGLGRVSVSCIASAGNFNVFFCNQANATTRGDGKGTGGGCIGVMAAMEGAARTLDRGSGSDGGWVRWSDATGFGEESGSGNGIRVPLPDAGNASGFQKTFLGVRKIVFTVLSFLEIQHNC